jgi:hypothetical protein
MSSIPMYSYLYMYEPKIFFKKGGYRFKSLQNARRSREKMCPKIKDGGSHKLNSKSTM